MKQAAPAPRAAGRGIFFLLGMALMGTLQALSPVFHPDSAADAGEITVNARSGQPAVTAVGEQPWGNFEYTRLPLEEPREFLPDTARPLGAPRWFFASSRKQVEELFNSADLAQAQKQILLQPQYWQSVSNGYWISPPSRLVLEMGRPARERIYSVLADNPFNSAQCHPFRFRPDGLEQWLARTGLASAQTALLRRLIYSQAGSFCFCDGAILQGLLSANDFSRVVRSLYGESTFLMRLRVTSQTDIDALVRYWGRAGRAQALRPLLESMAQVPGGASVNISYLLPPFARVRLYTYPNPAADSSATRQNCCWTAMNFFNEKTDDRFLDCAYAQRILASEYEQISGPPRLGDVIEVADASGAPIHMCVYLADEVVFTKNGRDYIQPWVLMKLNDMLVEYRAKEPVQVTVYRSRKS